MGRRTRNQVINSSTDSPGAPYQSPHSVPSTSSPHHRATRYLFLDAFGTLVALDQPFERLQANLDALGYALPLADVDGAMRQEFAYYIQHSRGASDAEALHRLRLECAGVLLEAFRQRGHVLPLRPDEAVDALMGAIAFRLYPDVIPALDALAAGGLRMGLISNWDCSLPEITATLGLGRYLQCLAVSSLCGSEKPDPAIFREAIRCAGVPPEEAVHVGDSYRDDVLGARAAGMGALLLDRKGNQTATDVTIIHDLLGAAELLMR